MHTIGPLALNFNITYYLKRKITRCVVLEWVEFVEVKKRLKIREIKRWRTTQERGKKRKKVLFGLVGNSPWKQFVSNPNRNRKSYKTHDQQRLTYKPPRKPKQPWAHRYFNLAESEVKRYENAYIGVVEKPGMSYNIKEEFIQQWYFSVRATALGSNLVLLENLEEGEMEALIEGAQDWLATWFSYVRKWCPKDVDNECLTWVSYYGTPVHAWNEDFFKYVVFGTGEYVAADENTETLQKN